MVKFDTKMYLNFSNFRGRASAGGGQALVQKRGQVSDGGGGIGKIFAGWGGPPSPPPRKKTLLLIKINSHIKKYFDDFLNSYTLAVKSAVCLPID